METRVYCILNKKNVYLHVWVFADYITKTTCTCIVSIKLTCYSAMVTV